MYEEKPPCPFCGSKSVKKNGRFINSNSIKVQKYRCNKCEKSFTQGTRPIFEERKKKIIDYWLNNEKNFSKTAQRWCTTRYHVKKIIEEDVIKKCK